MLSQWEQDKHTHTKSHTVTHTVVSEVGSSLHQIRSQSLINHSLHDVIATEQSHMDSMLCWMPFGLNGKAPSVLFNNVVGCEDEQLHRLYATDYFIVYASYDIVRDGGYILPVLYSKVVLHNVCFLSCVLWGRSHQVHSEDEILGWGRVCQIGW